MGMECDLTSALGQPLMFGLDENKNLKHQIVLYEE